MDTKIICFFSVHSYKFLPFCSASDPDPDESEFFADPSHKIPYLDQFVLLIIYFKSINENYTKLESIFA